MVDGVALGLIIGASGKIQIKHVFERFPANGPRFDFKQVDIA